MRTQEQIDALIQRVTNHDKGNTEEFQAVLDVLENDIDYSEIEDKYYDGNETSTERYALDVREWLDGQLEEE